MLSTLWPNQQHHQDERTWLDSPPHPMPRKALSNHCLDLTILSGPHSNKRPTHWLHSEGQGYGAGEMTQWFRVYSAPTQDLSSVPRAHVRQLTTSCSSSFRGSNNLFINTHTNCGIYSHTRHTQYTHK